VIIWLLNVFAATLGFSSPALKLVMITGVIQMRVKIMEKDPERLRALAADWGIKFVPGCHPATVQIAVADVYLRELDKETRRALRQKSERYNER
jgi:hypothetical protein